MSQGTVRKIIITLALVLGAASFASAQTFGSISPYSAFGVGDMANPGTAYNKSMAGVGVASRTNRYINIMNPASVTARDSLSFMADFSLYSDNKVFRQGNLKSVSNTFNIGDCVMSFPMWKNTAMMIGITPYSGTGFSYSFDYDDPDIIGRTGNISYSALGQGALYQAFVGAGVTLFKRLSLGAEGIYYFGNSTKDYTCSFDDRSYNGVSNGNTMSINALSGKFGLQYEQPIGAGTVGVGATYTMGTKLKGYVDSYSLSTGSVLSDTLSFKSDTLAISKGVQLASETAVGISYRQADKWMVEFDYSRSDWSASGFDKVAGFKVNGAGSPYGVFTPTISQAFRLGFELTPNRNDIRYYMNRVTYRGGAYYKTEYYKLDGYQIASAGLTFGATFPLNTRNNGISVGFEIGQRGSVENNLIRERYFNFSVGINIFDIWFQKQVYY